MNVITRIGTLAVIVGLGLSACASASPTRRTLQAFESDQALSDLFQRWADEYRRRNAASHARTLQEQSVSAGVVNAAPAAKAAPFASDTITNVQHAGVDEGAIVKRHGEYLVILRRGRLFTVDVHAGKLEPISASDAYGADVDPRGAWYDEMLISGDTVAVIGYSYARGGTEIGLFTIERSGELRYRATYHLRSNDYYSSRNYASRLIGTKLVFYTPLVLNPWSVDPFASLPAMRRWSPGASAADFKRIAPATRIYRTDEELDPHRGLALHTVTQCDLARSELDCVSTAVMGPPGRVFYVSDSAVYVWTSAGSRAGAPQDGSNVFRIPLDGSAPTGLKVAGSPIDQFSFVESDGFLNVLLRSSGGGDAMGSAERPAGELALARLPLDTFSDGRERAPRSAYRALPWSGVGVVQNRYVGPYLIYGTSSRWARGDSVVAARAYAVRYASRDLEPQPLALDHGVDRIDALGLHAIVIGNAGADLHFTTVRLGARAQPVGHYVRAHAAQGETRSHGFYYRSDANERGIVGLPIVGSVQSSRSPQRNSASLLYLRNNALEMSELGTLDSHGEPRGFDDACRASCIDWYGNARPIFIGERVFALLGYEIVEGSLTRSSIVEKRRTSFAPRWIDSIP